MKHEDIIELAGFLAETTAHLLQLPRMRDDQRITDDELVQRVKSTWARVDREFVGRLTGKWETVR